MIKPKPAALVGGAAVSIKPGVEQSGTPALLSKKKKPAERGDSGSS
jgi:hypothetical protein